MDKKQEGQQILTEESPIGERMEAAKQEAQREVKGQDIMALERFDENTRHMIEYTVLSEEASWGFKGERLRLFLNEEGYKKAIDFQGKGYIKIDSHAKVFHGHLFPDQREHVR